MRTWDSGEGNESVGLGALLPVWLRLALSSIKENREQPDTTAGAGDRGLALQRRTKTSRPPKSGPGQTRAVLPQQVGNSKDDAMHLTIFLGLSQP